MTIVNYDFLTGVYPSVGKSDYKAEEVNSFHTPLAQAQIEGLLSSEYTVPFSSNNLTAKDLIATLTYSRLAPMSEETRRDIRTELYERIGRLKSGEELMITTSGSLIPSTSGVAWSDGQSYHKLFTEDDPLMWIPDSSQIIDLRDERGQT